MNLLFLVVDVLNSIRRVKEKLGHVVQIHVCLGWLYISLIMGHLHDDVTLLLQLNFFRVLLSCANWGFCSLILTGTTKFKYEKRSEKDSGCSSKITPLFKWPIISRS